jgi:hypothetical protein
MWQSAVIKERLVMGGTLLLSPYYGNDLTIICWNTARTHR